MATSLLWFLLIYAALGGSTFGFFAAIIREEDGGLDWTIVLSVAFFSLFWPLYWSVVLTHGKNMPEDDQ